MKFLARRSYAFSSPLFLALALGCANQHEGERCDFRNGNIDCDDGLYCMHYQPVPADYICCPVVPPVTAPACLNISSPVDSGAPTTDANGDGAAESSAPDAGTNDAVAEPTEDRSMVDTRGDVAPDLSADMSTPDIQPEGAPRDATDVEPDANGRDVTSPDAADDTSSPDAPSVDASPDIPIDAASEASSDAATDPVTPIDAEDAADAPSADGPG